MRNNVELKIREEKCQEYQQEYGKNLYHYTSLAALYSILKNKEFWWGNTATMNDKSELTDFTSRLKKAIQKDLPEENSFLFENMFNEIKERVNSEYPFAMSFSSLVDDAAQWERYGDGARGVCISFNTRKICELFYYHNAIISKMIYKYDIRDHQHYKLLKEYFATGKLTGFSDIEGLIDNIIACASFHKHNSFSSECEYRISTALPLTDKRLLNNCSTISFELLGGQIKKVLKIDFFELCKNENINAEDLFDEIIIGPRSEQSQNNLKEFCRSMGFERLSEHIRVSTCPLR